MSALVALMARAGQIPVFAQTATPAPELPAAPVASPIDLEAAGAVKVLKTGAALDAS